MTRVRGLPFDRGCGWKLDRESSGSQSSHSSAAMCIQACRVVHSTVAQAGGCHPIDWVRRLPLPMAIVVARH
jgi:hypothetical protein